MAGDAEARRLDEADELGIPWRRWGPYLSERQWGTVREDYSHDGDAWSSFTHDQARSRAYRWGEDGIAGISDDKQRLCFALALWNGRDPILKERMFGLTNAEGNHGEDVKEYYFYLDSTPTHSYMKYLYKYPQARVPVRRLVATNRRRGSTDFEYELLDTGVFDDDRYFDVAVEYAKAAPEDMLIRVTVAQPRAGRRDAAPAADAAGSATPGRGPARRREAALCRRSPTGPASRAEHPELGDRWLYGDADVPLLFTENETNTERIFGSPNTSPYVKDGIDRYVVHGETGAVNPDRIGTKAAAHYVLDVPAGGSATVRLRLTDAELTAGRFDADFDELVDRRRPRPTSSTPTVVAGDAERRRALVVRQALAGMLWTQAVLRATTSSAG